MKDRELHRRLRAIREPAPPPELRGRLESGIPVSSVQPEIRGRGSWTMIKIGALTTAAAMVIAAGLWIGVGPGGTNAAFAAALDPVLEATDGARAVHVVLTMLTREGEDFSYVNLEGEPQEVEAWIEWPREPGDSGRARVNKTDRIYVFDGTGSIFYHPLRRDAFRGTGRFGHELFWPATWVRQIRNQPGDVEILAQEDFGARTRMTIREKGAADGRLAPSFLGDFDRETEIEWDSDTKLLTGLKRWVLLDGERRLFSELVAVEYLQSVDDSVFALEIPDDVRWGGVPAGPVELLELGPREVAHRLFIAAQRGDREGVELFCPAPATVDYLLDEKYRPAEIVYIGEPFRSGDYPGVYVPYKVRFGTGWLSMKEFNLALRNDNDQNRWVYDGGI